MFAATLPAWLVGARMNGLYRLDERRANGGGVEEWLRIGRLMVIGTWAALALAWVARIEQPETARLVVFAALAVTFAATGRAAARALARRRQRLCPERGHRGGGRGRPARRPEAPAATRSTA